MNRVLQKCPACGEWFNTTTSVMLEHYKARHEHLYLKALEIARLVVLREQYLAQSRVAPFPTNIQYCTMAALTNDQLNRVASQQL